MVFVENIFLKVCLPMFILASNVLNTTDAESYNILGIFSMRFKSRYVIFSSLTSELARRGHNVEVYTVYPSNKTIEGVQEIDISTCLKNVENSVNRVELFRVGETIISRMKFRFNLRFYLIPKPHELGSCQPIMELGKCTKKFDAVLMDAYDADLFSVFAFKFNATLIYIHANSLPHYLRDRMGSTSNPSYVNDHIVPLPMSFFYKLINVVMHVSTKVYEQLYLVPMNDDVLKEVFGVEIPSVAEILRNTSLVLVNTFFVLHEPVSLAPNVVQVGGIHIRSASELPQVRLGENLHTYIEMENY